jgi:hypothetical protein
MRSAKSSLEPAMPAFSNISDGLVRGVTLAHYRPFPYPSRSWRSFTPGLLCHLPGLFPLGRWRSVGLWRFGFRSPLRNSYGVGRPTRLRALARLLSSVYAVTRENDLHPDVSYETSTLVKAKIVIRKHTLRVTCDNQVMDEDHPIEPPRPNDPTDLSAEEALRAQFMRLLRLPGRRLSLETAVQPDRDLLRRIMVDGDPSVSGRELYFVAYMLRISADWRKAAAAVRLEGPLTGAG